MLKNPEKSQREIPVAPAEARYKKKSRQRGLPRSKHKHQYQTVLLHYMCSLSKPHEQDPLIVDYLSATKVCQICGRVGDRDPDFYEAGRCGGWLTSPKLLPEAQNLDKWCVDEYPGTFAKKGEIPMFIEKETAFCTNCAGQRRYTLNLSKATNEVHGISFEYIEHIAHCVECGKALYIAEINDANAQAQEDAYRAAKECENV